MRVEGSVFLTQPEFNPFAKKARLQLLLLQCRREATNRISLASFWIGRRRVYPTRYELERRFLAGRMLLHGLLARPLEEAA